MKNTWRTISTLTLGAALAFGMANTAVEAAEQDTSTEVKKESKLLDINLPKLPIVGEVKISIPSKDSGDVSLVSVNVSDGIVDDLSVDVGAESVTEDGGTKKSLATVGVKSSLTNDVNVDVASGDRQEGSFDGGLVEVNAEDLPLLGETHVGVLDTHAKEEEGSTTVSSGLAQVDVDGDLLEDTSVKVLAAEKNTNADGQENMTAAADVSIGGGALEGIVDDAEVSVLKKQSSEQDDVEQSKSSISSIGLKSDLTDDVNVDVGLDQKRTDGESSATDAGLVEVNAKDLPLAGETHVGVLDKHVEKDGDSTSVSTGVVQVDLDGDLLEGTSVYVLAKTENENGESTEKTSAVADVSVGGGILEGLVNDLNVSVLKKNESMTEDTTDSKSSIISVGLESPLTEDVAVDVGSGHTQSDDGSMSFDGGLVDVNASDLPVLGETHVGILDKHIQMDEDSLSFSTGLAQIGLDGDLLEDMNVNVLYKNGEMTEDGLLVTSGVAGVDLGLTGLEPIAVDVLKREELFPVNTDNPPSTGGGDDGNTVPPTVIEPAPGDGDGNGNSNTVPPTVIEPAPGNGDGNDNEDNNSVPPTVIVPAPGDEDDSSDVDGEGNGTTDGNGNNSTDTDGNEDGTTVVPGDDSGTPPGQVDADKGDRETGMDGNAVTDTDMSTGSGKKIITATVLNDGMTRQTMMQNPTRGSLPQTGGIFDGKRLAVLAVLLLISGAGLRKFGRSGQPAT